MQGFELFENNFTSKSVDKIAITASYQINFLADFYIKNQISSKKSVMLHFNKATDEIAAVFLNELVSGAYKLIPPNNGKNGCYIVPMKFFTRNGLMGSIAFGRYEYRLAKIDDNQAFVFKIRRTNDALPDGFIPYPSRKTKRR